MKKIVVLLVVACVALWGGLAFAGEGMEVEAGIKTWYNKWTNDDPLVTKTNYDASLLVGPAVEVKFPSHLFIEASYLMSVTDYESTFFLHKLTADRKDLDLAVGYEFSPSFGAFLGYKSVAMDWNMDLSGVIIDSRSFDTTGPMVGIRGNFKLNEMFSIYGNATYLLTKLETKTSTGTTKEDAPGTIFELGAKAAFSKHLSATLGYKAESTKEDKTNIKDTFAGFTLGMMYAFE
jgi:predicted porin